MHTLKDLAVIYSNSPVMLATIKQAILYYSPNTKADIISGKPSYDKRSNICKKHGNRVVDILPGARRQHRSEGYKNVVILSDL